jgi:folate-binding protein YgfZ
VIRDVVVVEGPEARDYLQGQLSQDVVALEVGGSAFSLLLQPQGKVDAWVRVTRLADETFALDVEAGWGEHVLARLRRFLLRTKAQLRLEQWPVAVGADGELDVPDGAWAVVSEVEGTSTVLNAHGGIDDADFDARRIAAGVPRMGRELGESTIPAAAGIVDRSVSFTKGCYTGQELVARIDSRGDRVPARLRRVSGRVQVGDTLVVNGREVGTITSAAGDVALAYVRREVEPPVDADAGTSATRVRIEA